MRMRGSAGGSVRARRPRRAVRAAALALAAGVALAGCGGQVRTPEDRNYRLVAPAAAPVSAGAILDGPVLVKRFMAAGILAERALVWASADRPEVLQQYHYRFWSEPPPVLLQELTVDVLREAGLAPEVVTPRHGVEVAYTVSGRIRRLEHLVGAAPAIAVSVELSLFDNLAYRMRVLDTYTVNKPLAADDPDAAVKAINDALIEILARFLAEVRSAGPG